MRGMTTTASTLNAGAAHEIDPLAARRAAGLALVLALGSIPGSTIAWKLPAGGLWLGLPLALAAVVLGLRARHQGAGTGMATAAIAIGALAIGQMVVYSGASAAKATPPGKPGPIAFQRFVDPKDEDNSQIFSVARPGAKARKLTTGGNGFNPDYSPDGERIVFERRFGGVKPDAIVTMGSDGSSPALVPTTCVADPCLGDNSPAWSPDGNLVFERASGPIVNDEASGGLELVVTNADGSEQVLRHFRSEGREPHDAQWSPDGTRIAVNVLNITAKPRNGSAIYVLNADGTDLHRVTPIRLNAGSPDWSPDGKRIAFNSSYEGQAAVEIYTVRPAKSGLRRLCAEPSNSASFEPTWSPGGRRLAFVHATRTQIPHIWTMTRNGKQLRQVTHGPKPDVRPDWGSR
jgi:Tol biopolymer transport system component